jgi:hypothetical protein
VFPEQLAGPIRGQLAVDLMAALLYDIDEARLVERKVVVLKADIAQAFPSVRPGRMAKRVVQLGLGA